MSSVLPHIEIKRLTKTIAVGYLLIIALIGGIVYIWDYEKCELKDLEAENHKIDRFRQEVHRLYAGLVGLSLMGENLLDIEIGDWDTYHARLVSVDSLKNPFLKEPFQP